MPPPDERWRSVDEIAANLDVARETVYRWNDRRNPAHRIGMFWKFKVSEVDAWVHAGKAGEVPEPPAGEGSR